MRWIDDVRDGLAGLDSSPGALRRFGLLVGAVLALAGWLLLHRAPRGGAALGVAAVVLVTAAVASPATLRASHRAWMALAFALGWLVSRAVLTAVFLVAVTPLALAARLAGKRFLDLRRDPGAASHWVRRPPGRPHRYEKMY